MKKPYLVAYDYGQGAVWAYISAESPEQIIDQLPDFTVVETPPSWMTEDIRKTVEIRMSFDIDKPSGWLAEVIELRQQH